MISLCTDQKSSHLTTGFYHGRQLRNLHLFMSCTCVVEIDNCQLLGVLYNYKYNYFNTISSVYDQNSANAILNKSSAREIVTTSRATCLTWKCKIVHHRKLMRKSLSLMQEYTLMSLEIHVHRPIVDDLFSFCGNK